MINTPIIVIDSFRLGSLSRLYFQMSSALRCVFLVWLAIITLDAKDENMVNPYKYNYILEAAPCTQRDELLIVVHTSTKVSSLNNV